MKASKDLRELIEKLEGKGELVRIKREVDTRSFELASYIRHMEDGPNRALLFEKIKGYSMPVVANLYGSIKRVAIGLGIDVTQKDIAQYRKDPKGSPGSLGGISLDAFSMTDEERALWILVQKRFHELENRASEGEFSTQMVNSAPCKEVVLTKEIDVLATIPVPWFCEGDGGPFVNPGGLVARDPDTGILNIGGYRHMVFPQRFGKDRIGTMIVEINDGYQIIDKRRRRGEKYVEVALCIGMDPATNLMAWYRSPHFFHRNPWSEFHTASGFLGEPLKMVKCETVDLEVPANTEIVIEGKLPTDEMILEGPMAEYTDMYSSHKPEPFIEVTAITHRKDAIAQVLLSGMSREHATTGWFVGLGWADYFLARVRKHFPTVKDAAFFAGSFCIHLVVSLKQRHTGEDRQLLNYLMGTTNYKFITIVDEDIDPNNSEQVEWARNMRAGKDPDDYVIFPKSRAYGLDPCHDERGLVTKLGILATLPFGKTFVRPGPPKEWLDKTRKAFEEEAGGGS